MQKLRKFGRSRWYGSRDIGYFASGDVAYIYIYIYRYCPSHFRENFIQDEGPQLIIPFPLDRPSKPPPFPLPSDSTPFSTDPFLRLISSKQVFDGGDKGRPPEKLRLVWST